MDVIVRDFVQNRDLQDYEKILIEVSECYIKSDEYVTLPKANRIVVVESLKELITLINKLIRFSANFKDAENGDLHHQTSNEALHMQHG